jgi:hypothetical protein
MKITFPIAAIVVAMLAAGVAAAASPFTKYSGTIKLTTHTFTLGKCTDSDPHAELCPSGAACHCETFAGTYSGTAGKGTATGVATVDEGEGQAPVAGGAAGCSPSYGVIRIIGSKDTETFEVDGGSCANLDGSASNGGGCVMESSSRFAEGAVVFCSSSINSKGDGMVLMKGLAK